MKKTIQLIINIKNLKEAEQFYNFQKEYSGELYVSVPTTIEDWRKQK